MNLQRLLVERGFFRAAWEQNEFEVKSYWIGIEGSSSSRMVNAYRGLLELPESESDKNHLWRVATLLDDTGHPGGALRLRSERIEHFRSTGDQNNCKARSETRL